MYITGDQFDLENRLHQLGEDLTDLQSFQTEANGYTLDDYVIEKLNREFTKKQIIFLDETNWLDTWVV